jgi:hypothetical protein
MLPEEIHLRIKTSLQVVEFKVSWNNKEIGFKENDEDNCIYAKFENGKFNFCILYVDDILLASSDVDMLLETKEGFVLKFWYEWSSWSVNHSRNWSSPR